MENQIRFPLRWEKLAAAVAYLVQQSLHDDRFGETKLVKLLYYADCAAYQRTGEPITGTTYVRMPHGPYPDEWQVTKRRLEELDIIRVVGENVSTTHTRQRALVDANASVEALTEGDKAFLDEQLRRFREFTAAAIEEYAHEDLAWQATGQGASIPYELSGIRRPGQPDDETRARGNRIAKRIREEGRRVSRVMVTRDETI